MRERDHDFEEWAQSQGLDSRQPSAQSAYLHHRKMVDLRDEFAGKAMQGMIDSEIAMPKPADMALIAGAAYDMADAMLAARETRAATGSKDGHLSHDYVLGFRDGAKDAYAKADKETDRLRGLLREARATFEMWKDVAPAVSLCADIDAALASGEKGNG